MQKKAKRHGQTRYALLLTLQFKLLLTQPRIGKSGAG